METQASDLVHRISNLLTRRNREFLTACADPSWLAAPGEIESQGERISRTSGALERATLVAHKVSFARRLASWPAERLPGSSPDAKALLAAAARKLAPKIPHSKEGTARMLCGSEALKKLKLERNLLKPIWAPESDAYLLPEKFAAAWANRVLSGQSPYLVEMMPPGL